MKKMIVTALAASLILSLAGCGSKGAETEKTTAAAGETKEAGAEAAGTEATGGTLVMATNAEFPPYEYREGDNVVGIDVEIGEAIAKSMGMELKVEDMAFDSIIVAVDAGKADVGLAGLTVTEDRLMNVNFSDPYTTATQVVIVKDDSPITSPNDLEGKKIGVQLGTTGDQYAGDIKDATVERYNKGFEAVQAMTQGKIDAVIIDREPAKVFVEQNEGIKMLDKLWRKNFISILLKMTVGNTLQTDC